MKASEQLTTTAVTNLEVLADSITGFFTSLSLFLGFLELAPTMLKKWNWIKGRNAEKTWWKAATLKRAERERNGRVREKEAALKRAERERKERVGEQLVGKAVRVVEGAPLEDARAPEIQCTQNGGLNVSVQVNVNCAPTVSVNCAPTVNCTPTQTVNCAPTQTVNSAPTQTVGRYPQAAPTVNLNCAPTQTVLSGNGVGTAPTPAAAATTTDDKTHDEEQLTTDQELAAVREMALVKKMLTAMVPPSPLPGIKARVPTGASPFPWKKDPDYSPRGNGYSPRSSVGGSTRAPSSPCGSSFSWRSNRSPSGDWSPLSTRSAGSPWTAEIGDNDVFSPEIWPEIGDNDVFSPEELELDPLAIMQEAQLTESVEGEELLEGLEVDSLEVLAHQLDEEDDLEKGGSASGSLSDQKLAVFFQKRMGGLDESSDFVSLGRQ